MTIKTLFTSVRNLVFEKNNFSGPDNAEMRQQRCDPNQFNQAPNMTGQPDEAPSYSPLWTGDPAGISQPGTFNSQRDPGRSGQGSSMQPHVDARSQMPGGQHNDSGEAGASDSYRTLTGHLGHDGSAFPQAFLRVNKAEAKPTHFRAATERLIGPGRHAAGGDPRNLSR